MNARSDRTLSRRTVLKTAGVIGGSSFASRSASGTATARIEGLDLDDVDDFLNEDAAFKENAIWDGTVLDLTDEDPAQVRVGAMTDIDHPDLALTVGPYAFAPQVVAVTPGSTVRWVWVKNPLGAVVPHDVTSLDVVVTGDEREDAEEDDEEETEDPTEDRITGRPLFHAFHHYQEPKPIFEFDFENPGHYLYYCSSHGSPFEVRSRLGEDVTNEFGMRAAVVVIEADG